MDNDVIGSSRKIPTKLGVYKTSVINIATPATEMDLDSSKLKGKGKVVIDQLPSFFIKYTEIKDLNYASIVTMVEKHISSKSNYRYN